MDQKWGMLSEDNLILELNTNLERGLSFETADKVRKAVGNNELEDTEHRGLLAQIVDQFKNPLAAILLISGIITFLLGEFLDTTVIGLALLINIVIGIFQEGRASKAFDVLNAQQTHSATVVRDGVKHTVPASDLVPGDVVILEMGSFVPADVRIIACKDFEVNEAALTGEWIPVPKRAGEQHSKKPSLAEQFNMAWMGTLVANGQATAVVVETGMKTRVGALAESLGSKKERLTPLQQNIRQMASFLIYLIAGAVILVFAFGIFRGESIGEMLLIAIALSVAAMPEGLPAAVTVVLALGMEKILKEGGLVRSLLAAETLGSTTIILTDKTGTLTEAKMVVSEIVTMGEGEAAPDKNELMIGAVLSSDAFIERRDDETGEEALVVHGRPIEKAILTKGIELGLTQDELKVRFPQKDFLPFSSARRFAASLNETPDGEQRLYISGAPETLIAGATHAFIDGAVVPMTEELRSQYNAAQEDRSSQGMRVTAIAYRTGDVGSLTTESEDGKTSNHLLDKDVVFAGLLIFSDPIRSDVKESIEIVKHAGVRVIMVTGDNPETAYSIASQVGICKEHGRVVTGTELEDLNDAELTALFKDVSVFARVLPNQKLRIARVLKSNGETVAMTGDGVNDAPALRSADIGVAVGSGTEVAKEASDLVLLNNSFSIIVTAIKIGRTIIDNLKKIATFLISTSFSGIALIGGALVLGMPLPILPTQILWANIVQEGLMSFAFAFEPSEKNVMERDPRVSSSRTILTKELKSLIVLVAAITGGFLIVLYYVLLNIMQMPIDEIRTILFVSLSLDALFFAFSIKSFDTPIWKIPLASNKYLLFALGVSIVLLLAAVTLPSLQLLLTTITPDPIMLVILVGIGLFNLLVIEIAKYFTFRNRYVVN